MLQAIPVLPVGMGRGLRLDLHGLSDSETAMQAASDDEAAALEEGGSQAASLEVEHAETAAESSSARDQPAQEIGSAAVTEGTGDGRQEGLAGGESKSQSEQHPGALQPESSNMLEAEPLPAQDANGPEKPKGSAQPADGPRREQPQQQATGGPTGVIPPVLDILGEGLLKLIVPPGGGKKRSSYAGEPANPDNLPQPDPPSAVPVNSR